MFFEAIDKETVWSKIFDSIQDMVSIHDKDFTIIKVNKALADFFRMEPEEIIGRKCFELFHDKGEPWHSCPFCESMKSGKDEQGEVMDPHIGIPLLITSSNIYDDEGNLLGNVHIAKDISRIKETERQLRELNLTLEKRAKEEADKRRKQEQLLIQQSKLAAMGEMLSAISHQWRQPLTALGTLIYDIQDSYEYGEMNSAYLNKTTKVALGQIEYMSRTMDDFMKFFTPSKQKIPFSVRKAIQDASSIVAPLMTAGRISLQVRCQGDDTVMACGYPNEFIQVLINVINNAKDAIISHRNNNKIKNNDNNYEGLIAIEYSGEAEKVRITVKDNGGGIAQQAMDRVFDPYFTTKDAGKGTGIGLYMSKIIIEENMGGKIYAENTVEGAVFTITLDAVANVPCYDTIPA